MAAQFTKSIFEIGNEKKKKVLTASDKHRSEHEFWSFTKVPIFFR